MIEWNNYPYTDFHELNLDWILKIIKSLDAEMESFVNVNTIKYAEPLLWNITSQYEQNTLVQDSTGNTYLSKKPVPTGIPITNNEYWLKVADFSGTADVIRKSIADANDEASTTSSADREVGDLVWLSGFLYKVLRHINIGDAYVSEGDNPNVTKVTVEELLNELKTEISTTFQSQIDEETRAREESDALITGNLNKEITNRESSDNLINTKIDNEITARTDAVNTINGNINTINGNINTLDNKIDNETTNRENSDDLINNRIDDIEGRIVSITGRKYILVADSYGALGWTENVKTELGLDAYIINNGGAGFVGNGGGSTWNQSIVVLAGTLSPNERASITDIIVLGGVNDYSYTYEAVLAGATTFITYCKNAFPNAKTQIGVISNASGLVRPEIGYKLFNMVIPAYQEACGTAGGVYLPNMTGALKYTGFLQSDGLHPNENGTRALTNMIKNYILNGICGYSHFLRPCTVEFPNLNDTLHPKMYSSLNESVCTLIGKDLNFAFTKPINFSGAIDTGIVNIGTIKNTCVEGLIIEGLAQASVAINGVAEVYIDAKTRYKQMPFALNIYAGHIAIAFMNVENDPTRTEPFSSSIFQLSPFTASFNIESC